MFWFSTVLCVALGAGVAPHVGTTLGVDRLITGVLLGAALVVAVAAQVLLSGYLPAAYWLTVVLASVVGTLLADDLTNDLAGSHRVPLGDCSVLFAVLLAVVFVAWFATERTLSVQQVSTPRREVFYWLAVVVAFALGAALDDWTLEVTGWRPGSSLLLAAAVLAVVLLARRQLRAGAVWTFWLAFVLTRPLGADLGDFLGASSSDGGEGLGRLGTSVVFLAAILLTVVFLTASGIDRVPGVDGSENSQREAR